MTDAFAWTEHASEAVSGDPESGVYAPATGYHYLDHKNSVLIATRSFTD
ncbi:MAG: hypothetical protein JWO39_2717 [Gemmatimonadetes bacterium]|jgi:hypothetical protein|nr:hypothetical protein [Gemmatimonadota bacterium]